MKYLFFLGNHPKLALAEIQSILDYFDINISSKSLTSSIYEVNTNKELPANLIDKLGGTIKIAQIIDLYDRYDASGLSEFIDESDKIFALSFYHHQIRTFEILTLLKKIKKIIARNGKKISFVLPKNGTSLSSAQVAKRISRKGIEINILNVDNQFLVSKTIGCQNIDRWSRLDYGVPAADALKGMLPPKLAQTMINLALSKDEKMPVIYDPFCGNGRVMIQALLNGFESYASDIDEKSIENTKTNIKWLNENFNINNKIQFLDNIFAYDATKPSVIKYIGKKVNAIVTEPYLGKPMKIAPSLAYTKKMFSDLSKIYLTSLTNFKDILEDKSKIVMVFPRIGDNSLLNEIVDKIGNLGYHKVSNFNYSRDYQIVKREIVVFDFRKVNN